ncbi:MAG: hypothetical protein FWC26_07970 [Fibromonadales bacterium]|nr:hypothetical protein [Fibromonadales bacterium]
MPTRVCIFAAADIENLFSNSVKIITHPDKKSDRNIRAIHRFVTPLYGDNVVFITVKEATIEGKRIYSIELIELGELEGKLDEVKSYPFPLLHP